MLLGLLKFEKVGEQKRSLIEKHINFKKMNFGKVGGRVSDSFITDLKLVILHLSHHLKHTKILITK
jgi:hypothetical protein